MPSISRVELDQRQNKSIFVSYCSINNDCNCEKLYGWIKTNSEENVIVQPLILASLIGMVIPPAPSQATTWIADTLELVLDLSQEMVTVKKKNVVSCVAVVFVDAFLNPQNRLIKPWGMENLFYIRYVKSHELENEQLITLDRFFSCFGSRGGK